MMGRFREALSGFDLRWWRNAQRNKLVAAKELFLKYGGSHFHMSREGDYDRYLRLGISKEQELIWAEEAEKEYVERINRESDAYGIECTVSGLDFYLENYYNATIALQLIETLSSKQSLLDSFSKVLIAERIIHIVRNGSARSAVAVPGRKLASDLLQSVIQNPITVAPAYSDLGYLADVLTEDKIRLRAAEDLKKCGT